GGDGQFGLRVLMTIGGSLLSGRRGSPPARPPLITDGGRGRVGTSARGALLRPPARPRRHRDDRGAPPRPRRRPAPVSRCRTSRRGQPGPPPRPWQACPAPADWLRPAAPLPCAAAGAQ